MDIAVEIYVVDFPYIDDLTQTISMNMDLYLEWKEPRLKLNYEDGFQGRGDVDENDEDDDHLPLEIHSAGLNELWKPDLMIFDLIKFEELVVLDKSSGLQISKDKTVFFYTSAYITFSCIMKFDKYPMDSQVCPLKFQSLKYTLDRVNLESEFTFYPDEDIMSQDFEVTIKDLVS